MVRNRARLDTRNDSGSSICSFSLTITGILLTTYTQILTSAARHASSTSAPVTPRVPQTRAATLSQTLCRASIVLRSSPLPSSSKSSGVVCDRSCVIATVVRHNLIASNTRMRDVASSAEAAPFTKYRIVRPSRYSHVKPVRTANALADVPARQKES